MHDDVEAMYAGLRAFNRWLEEDWGYGDDGRFYSAPMISLVDVDEAVREMQRVLDLGAKVVHVRRGPLYGEAPAAPSRDRFWALAQEAGVPVAIHTGDAAYTEVWATQWGEPARPPLQYTSAFSRYLSESAAGDMFANLILNNLFQRFPQLTILSIENGCSWIPSWLKRLDKAAVMGRGTEGLGGAFTDVASDVFKRNFYVCPFFEEDPIELAGVIGADRVMFGSDWPHPEGLAEPLEFATKVVGHVSDDDAHRIMYANAAALVGHRS
jgi:predicted TIM-barrel fold metal-dependent hydrolase